jgi:micrococcal nuclease
MSIKPILLPVAIVLVFSMIPVQFNYVSASSEKNCDPLYPEVCIAPPPPDLNCDDVPYTDIKVEGDDPHGFDREGDGIVCES